MINWPATEVGGGIIGMGLAATAGDRLSGLCLNDIGTEIATELGEGMTHICDAAIAVIGQAFDHHRDAARTVVL